MMIKLLINHCSIRQFRQHINENWRESFQKKVSPSSLANPLEAGISQSHNQSDVATTIPRPGLQTECNEIISYPFTVPRETNPTHDTDFSFEYEVRASALSYELNSLDYSFCSHFSPPGLAQEYELSSDGLGQFQFLESFGISASPQRPSTPMMSHIPASPRIPQPFVPMDISMSNLPQQTLGNTDITELLKSSKEDLIKLIVFLFDNNYHTEKNVECILEQLFKSTPLRLLNDVLNIIGPFDHELARKVFPIALRAKNWDIVSIVLAGFEQKLPAYFRIQAIKAALENENGLLLEKIIQPELDLSNFRMDCCQNHRGIHALEFSSIRRNPQLTDILLRGKYNNLNTHLSAALSLAIICRHHDNSGDARDSVIMKKTHEYDDGENEGNADIEDDLDLKVINLLVNAGADVNSIPLLDDGVRKRRLKAPIRLAVAHGRVEIIKYLVEKGSSVKRDSPGAFALQDLCLNWDKFDSSSALEIAQILIRTGVDIHLAIVDDQIKSYDFDPFDLFTYERDKVHKLNRRWAAEWGKDVKTVDLAASTGSLELIRLLHNTGAQFTLQSLCIAIIDGHHALAEALSAFIPDLDVAFTDLPKSIATTQHPRMDDPEKRPITNLENKSENWSSFPRASDSTYVLELLKWLPEGNQLLHNEMFIRAAICDAACYGELTILKRLLDFVTETWQPTQAYSLDPSAIVRAISSPKNTIEVMELLLQHGAEVGESVVIEALRQKQPAFLDCLLKYAMNSILIRQPLHWQDMNLGELSSMARIFELAHLYPPDPGAFFEGQSLATAIITAAIDCGNVDFARECIQRLDIPIVVWTTEFRDSLRYWREWAGRGTYDALQVYLELGLDVTQEDILECAAYNGNYELVHGILEAYEKRHGTCRKPYGTRTLEQLIFRDLFEPKIVHKMLSFGIDPLYIRQLSSAFGKAIERASTSLQACQHLRTILETNPNANSIVYMDSQRHQTALLAAVKTKNLPVVKLLVEAGADIHLPATRQTQRTPLQAACEAGDLSVVQYLLKLGANVNTPAHQLNGGTALQFAAFGGHISATCLLLEAGADVNAPGAQVNGRTALEGAAEHGRVSMIRLLLNEGAEVIGSGEKQYRRALWLAESNGHEKAASILRNARIRAEMGLSDPLMLE